MTLRLGDTLIAGSGANQDLSNLTSQGQNIANWSSNVTNCITEIAQDIKLELNNGTLTLKAGSKVYVPNGVGVFDTRITTSDSSWILNSNNIMVYVKPDGDIDILLRNYCYSGSTAPTSFQDNKYAVWYDTTNNVVKRTGDAGATWTTGYSLPVYIADSDNSYQVFNGFGYIGSTVFALPNVKGLIPNGRNDDGTLKNIEISFSKVVTKTNNVAYSGDVAITSDYFDLAQGDLYNETDNRNYLSDGVTPFKRCIAGKFVKGTNGIVTSLTLKTTFHALDYNDSSTISGWSMPSSRYMDLTIGATGSTYTAPANGIFNICLMHPNNGDWIAWGIDVLDGNGNFLYNIQKTSWMSNQTEGYVIQIQKGYGLRVFYTTMSVTRFRFIYAEGEN